MTQFSKAINFYIAYEILLINEEELMENRPDDDGNENRILGCCNSKIMDKYEFKSAQSKL